MGAGLYRTEPVFTESVEEVFALLGPAGDDVRADWLSDAPAVPLEHPTRSQILLFAVDYAISRQIMSWGVRPAALLGHSAGELVAATLAGVFALADAVEVLWDRINRLEDAPPGGMLAVAGNPEQVSRHLGDGVVVGAVNSPSQVILAGPCGPLDQVAAALSADGFMCRAVPTTVGFHSPMLTVQAEETVPLIEKIGMAPPRIPLYSGYTTRRLTDRDAADAHLWASHMVAPVLFWPALTTLLGDGDFRLVEAGPGQALATVARRHPAVTRGGSSVLAASPPRALGAAADVAALRKLAGALA
jgi:acyl transferase domain-containing protein